MTPELRDLVRRFRHHLYLPDDGSLLTSLATIAANRMEGDPLWVMVVGPPSSGRSELIQPIAALPDVFPTAELTVAGLLSGTSQKETAADAKGGLLREIGDFGIILCKDFGTVLSMAREGRQAVLAALREVYDGEWNRRLGTDGGLCLPWKGKVGFLGAGHVPFAVKSLRATAPS